MRYEKISCIICSLALSWLLCSCGTQADGLVLVGESGMSVSKNVPEADSGGNSRKEAGKDPTSDHRSDPTADHRSDPTADHRSDPTAESEELSRIYVYVCGAVNCPGVVALREGSRAEAALEAAGGLREDARTDWVNLAAKVKDGEKLYFPTVDEAAEPVDPDGGDGLININTADAETLCTLSGIGESRARDILRYREEHGFFENREDIMKVPGIKTSVYNRIKDRIKTE